MFPKSLALNIHLLECDLLFKALLIHAAILITMLSLLGPQSELKMFAEINYCSIKHH